MSHGAPALRPPAVAYEPWYVLGCPAHVAVELALDGDGALVLPWVDWVSTRGRVGLLLTGVGGDTVVWDHHPLAAAAAGEAPVTFALRRDRPRRVLVDLAELLPDALAPGYYTATVGYQAGAHAAWSAPFALAFRAPTREQRARVKALRRDDAPGTTWGEWATTPPDAPLPPDAPPAADDPLRFNLTLRALLLGATPLASLDRAALKPLGGVYEPEREVLWAEALWARGDAAAFATHASAVLQAWPGLAWWVEAIAEDRGPIAAMRGALQAVLAGA